MYYVIQFGYSILGTGKTAQAAIDDANQYLDEHVTADDLRCVTPASGNWVMSEMVLSTDPLDHV